MFAANMAKSFTSEAAQSAEQIADVIKAVLDADNPSLRYQTSEYARKAVAGRVHDTTGDNYLNFQTQRFFSGAK